MNKYLIIIGALLVLLTSCASKPKMSDDLKKRVQNEEVRSLKEIKSHAKIIIKSHPEIDDKTRSDIKNLLTSFIDSHLKLREKESKVVTLLVKKSIRYEQLTNKEKKQKKILRKQLASIYEDKRLNVEVFLDKVISLHKQNKIDADFQDDLIIFMRDWR